MGDRIRLTAKARPLMNILNDGGRRHR